MDIIDKDGIKHIPRAVRPVWPMPEIITLCGEKIPGPFSERTATSDCPTCKSKVNP